MTRLLPQWVAWVTHRPWMTLGLLLALTMMFGAFSASRFSIDTEMGSLIRQEAPWRDHYERFKAAFPERHDSALVVVSGSSLEAVQRATRSLADALADDGRFSNLFAPLADPFFDRNALLFLSIEQLEEVTDRLAAAQPVLGAVAEGRGLAGVLEVAAQAIRHQDVAELEALLEPLTASAEDIAAGGDGAISWRDRLFADTDRQTHYSLITFGKPRGEDVTDREFMARTRAVIERAQVMPGIEVRISGAIALGHEEVAAAQEGVRMAGIVSVLLLAIILYFGVGSFRIIVATAAMLGAGVVWTTAWGLLAVGHFNPLSLIFAVVFFGLGVDFAIHYALRIQEALADQATLRDALKDAATNVGGAILLCALTTAIGFLAFVPTAYQGVSQLGIIAAGGMAVAAFLTLTLIPALLCVLGRPSSVRTQPPRTARLATRLLRARRPVLMVTTLIALAAVALVPRLRFDHSVLALKNPHAESMQVLRELQREGVTNDYTISVLADDAARIPALIEQLQALDAVAGVESPFDFVPANQEDKQLILEDIGFMLGEIVTPHATTAAPDSGLDELETALETLLQEIEATAPFGEEVNATLQRLVAAVHALRNRNAALTTWDSVITGSLQRELEWLREALSVEIVGFDDLPSALQQRVRSDVGLWHLAVLPQEDIGATTATLTRYVEAVLDIVPEATGRPVLEWGLGKLVLNAFLQALALALLAVSVVLLLVLRDLRATLLVLLPLMLAALFTVSVQVLFNLPLNMANILVLPLIFGLGVGNGIHMVQRYRHGQQLDAVLSSSTPRAVMLSALTTLGAFATLALSPHYGTASIGLLLTVAVALLLLTVVFLLPVFLASFGTPND